MVASSYGIREEQKALWVYLEQNDRELEGVSLELLGKARRLANQAGWPLAGLLLGHRVGQLAGEAFAFGADEVWLADHRLLDGFTVEMYAHAAHQAIMEGRPSVFLIGATHNGRDLAGRLAVRLRTGLNADCTDLKLDPKSGSLASEVTGFGGGVLACLECPQHRPQMSTVRPGVFPLGEREPGRTGQVFEIPIRLNEGMIQTHIVERVAGEALDLTKAPALVCGGRGVSGEFQLLRDLADLIGGEVGATRPPVDEGYVPREQQVGQTGVVCRPKVAIACGISGAFHFMVGIQEAGMVVAINTDPEAPIFEFADYCVIGDALQVLPAMIKAFQVTGEADHA